MSKCLNCCEQKLETTCPNPMACPIMWMPLSTERRISAGAEEPMPTEEQFAAWGRAQRYADSLIAAHTDQPDQEPR